MYNKYFDIDILDGFVFSLVEVCVYVVKVCIYCFVFFLNVVDYMVKIYVCFCN